MICPGFVVLFFHLRMLRDRERERERESLIYNMVCSCFVVIVSFENVERERERERERELDLQYGLFWFCHCIPWECWERERERERERESLIYNVVCSGFVIVSLENVESGWSTVKIFSCWLYSSRRLWSVHEDLLHKYVIISKWKNSRRLSGNVIKDKRCSCSKVVYIQYLVSEVELYWNKIGRLHASWKNTTN